MENCCRTCLRDKRSNKMKLLSTKWNNTLISFADMLMNIVNMNKEITSNETTLRICSSCELDLITAYNFKIVCQNTEKILTERLAKTIFQFPTIEEIKCEPIIDDISNNLDKDLLDDVSSNIDENSKALILVAQCEETSSASAIQKIKKRKTKSTSKNSKKGEKINQLHSSISNLNEEKTVTSSEWTNTENERNNLIDKKQRNQNQIRNCRKCNISFEADKFYRKHIRQTHRDDKNKTNPSNRCKNNESVIKSENGKIRKPSVYCRKCDVRFEAEKFYRKHCEDVHWQTLPCTICGKLYLESRINSHMATHVTEKTYVCSTCGSKFSTNSHLQEHLRIHTGEKRYKCTFCDEKFIHSNSRKNHIYKVHTQEKKYECYICHHKFAQRGQMVIHIKYHLGDLRHPCSFCDKRFPHAYALKVHERRHGTPRKKRVCKKKIISETTGNLTINDALLIEVSGESSVMTH